MKKRAICALLALALLGAMAGCGNDEEAQSVSAASSAQETSAASESSAAGEGSAKGAAKVEGKTLVAVFSWANNADLPKDVDAVSAATLNDSATGGFVGDTQIMGQTAAEVTGGDYFDILVEKPYPGDEQKTYDQAKQEQLKQARPALSSHVANMDSYSTIVLVYPNWWGGLPMPVCTFLEEYDFSKKTIIPVCCYEAEDSGAGNSRNDIAELCDGVVTAGYNLRGNAASTSGTTTDFTNWLEDLPVKF